MFLSSLETLTLAWQKVSFNKSSLFERMKIEIVACLGTKLGGISVGRFADGEVNIQVRVLS